MLDRNAMAQLKDLREELEAQNEHVGDGGRPRSVYPAR